jgi:hypothetical protein
VRKTLEWFDGDPAYGQERAFGHGDVRLYRLFIQAHGRWMVTLASKHETAALARGWALSPDEAKQIAQEWEDGFGRYEYLPPLG